MGEFDQCRRGHPLRQGVPALYGATELRYAGDLADAAGKKLELGCRKKRGVPRGPGRLTRPERVKTTPLRAVRAKVLHTSCCRVKRHGGRLAESPTEAKPEIGISRQENQKTASASHEWKSERAAGGQWGASSRESLAVFNLSASPRMSHSPVAECTRPRGWGGQVPPSVQSPRLPAAMHF